MESMVSGFLLFFVALVASAPPPWNNSKLINFPQQHLSISRKAWDYLSRISSSEWNQFITSGIDSIDRQIRLEENLLSSDITVKNGSLSHTQLLDTLPNENSKIDSAIAQKILRGSLFVYNTKCVPEGISGNECRMFLENKLLPEGSNLRNECDKMLQSPRSAHHAFRRLLPRHYKNGFHQMFNDDDLPGAWSISMRLYDRDDDDDDDDDAPINRSTAQEGRSELRNTQPSNLVLVQFAQFVEHDLSKTVSQSMSNGYPIECCNKNQNNLQPRFHHPSCAPIVYNDKYNWPNCLNYVRSALALSERCTFGAAEQLNQVTGSLDLSQVYGLTDIAERKLRTLSNGALKSSSDGKLLPVASDSEDHTFCAWSSSLNASTCFMAGDSRANSNPLSILIYSIFLRNHNTIATELHERNQHWSDEQLFQTAKAINIDIYRRIIMTEWLPEVLGEEEAAEVLATPPTRNDEQLSGVSNEFGVAAIRFYFSMLPNVLHDLDGKDEVTPSSDTNNILIHKNLFELKNEFYKPQLRYNAEVLNEILQSILFERAKKMDTSYVNAIVWHEPTKPAHVDILAFDIQRGRDHGLQPYYKYLEACNDNIRVNGWTDFEAVMPKKIVSKLMGIYKNWTDVDLFIGGISEKTVKGIVGPTFKCILAEQFSKVHQRHQKEKSSANTAILAQYSTMNGTKLLCLNSNLRNVPANIFRLQSNTNLLVDCHGLK